MGHTAPQFDSSLVIFRSLLMRANWVELNPRDALMNDSLDDLPEVCFRTEYRGQIIEVSLHVPLEQITFAVSNNGQTPELKLFFFYRKHLNTLVRNILKKADKLELENLNGMLKYTSPHCLFTLLGLPNGNLYDVSPRAAAA